MRSRAGRPNASNSSVVGLTTMMSPEISQRFVSSSKRRVDGEVSAELNKAANCWGAVLSKYHAGEGHGLMLSGRYRSGWARAKCVHSRSPHGIAGLSSGGTD